MKNKAVLFGMAALLMTSATFAQSVENDDMYFNSKDRVKLKAKQAQEEAAYQTAITGNYGKKNQSQRLNTDANPTDTYSARNENPEFAARSNSQTANGDNQDYFVSDYKYNNVSKLNNWNNSFNSWYGSPWVASNYYSPSIYGWNSPYYGSYYDSWGNPWSNPYYRSGFSSSFSFYMGNSWNYGWGNGFGYGMGMAYGSPYLNSWYGWGSPYSSFGYGGYGGYGGFGSGYYGGGYYGGNNVVIINNGGGENGRNIAYGKRATSGGMVTSRQDALNSRTRSSSFTDNGGVRPTVGRDGSTTGRMPSSNPNSNVSVGRSNNQSQADYYNRSWRGSQQQNSGSSYAAPQRSSWSQSNGDSWNRSGSNNNNSGFNNSSNNAGRSSSFDGGGGGARSHSSVGGGGGSGGRSRGRD